jgi:hypothetical protein
VVRRPTSRRWLNSFEASLSQIERMRRYQLHLAESSVGPRPREVPVGGRSMMLVNIRQ